MATKPKTPPLYKAGDWIVTWQGRVWQVSHDWTRNDDFGYKRHATPEEIVEAEKVLIAEKERWAAKAALKATQPYQDAVLILCQDSEILIEKAGAELLHGIAERLRR